MVINIIRVRFIKFPYTLDKLLNCCVVISSFNQESKLDCRRPLIFNGLYFIYQVMDLLSSLTQTNEHLVGEF